MRVTIIFHKNCFGGSVRVQHFLSNLLLQNGYEVSLLALENGDDRGYFDNFKFDIIWKKKMGFWKNFHFFKKAISHTNPDLVISAIDYNNRFAVLATKILGKKIVICEHGNHLNLVSYGSASKKCIRRLFRFISYKLADTVTFLTYFDYNYFSYLKKKIVMLNPVMTEINYLDDNQSQKENIILFPSRMDENKRPMFILKAFSKIHDSGFKLVFLGGGEELNRCKEYVKKHNLGNVEFHEFTSDIISWYKRSKIVSLTSRSEGMPNILVEAMFYDCARISTNCITGPQELISDGVDGFLINVDDEEEYARKLQSLINDEQLRLSFCERAKVRCDEFSPEKISAKWLKLIQTL